MDKSSSLTPEEKRLWRHFMQNVRPLHSPESGLAEELTESSILSSVKEFVPSPPPAPSAPVEMSLQPGDLSQLDRRTAQRLKRGQRIIEAELDLHGYTQAEASHHFHRFLVETSQQGLRVLRIITGYGKMGGGRGVLREALPRWINLPENRRLVLSYHQARREEGGAGAWIIFLKRRERL